MSSLRRLAEGHQKRRMEASEPRVRLRVSPLAYLAGICAGVLMLAMVALLVAQLAILKDSREHIQAQDHKIATLQGDAQQALRDARPAIEEAEPLLRRARRLLTPAGESFETLTGAAETIPRLAIGARLLLTESIPLIQALNAGDAPAAIHATGHLARALTENDRAVRAIDTSIHMLDELERTRLIPRASDAIPRFEELLVGLLHVQKRTLRVQIRSFRTQSRQLRVQFQTLAVQRETLNVQREALDRIRSIDRKTGPPPPATPVTSAAP